MPKVPKFYFLIVILFFVFNGQKIYAAETLHPIKTPENKFSVRGIIELDEDIYSGDLLLYGEFAPSVFKKRFSIYGESSFRFLSYSYDYEWFRYLHNYANLHVNGFNESYLGFKFKILSFLGLNFNWRFPPGEGSQKNRFSRFHIEPFAFYKFSKDLFLGTSVMYDSFLEKENFNPGDEFGFKWSFIWRFFWNDSLKTGFEWTETLLYKQRLFNSENKNLLKPYQNMHDKYAGIKVSTNLTRYFRLFSQIFGLGLDYEIHRGTLFGFEDGHKLGFVLNYKY